MPVPRLNINAFKAFKLLFFLFVALGLGIFLYLPNYARLCKLHRANLEMKEKVSELKLEIDDLRQKLAQANKDPHFYEKIARDDLGVALQDEIVIDIEE